MNVKSMMWMCAMMCCVCVACVEQEGEQPVEETLAPVEQSTALEDGGPISAELEEALKQEGKSDLSILPTGEYLAGVPPQTFWLNSMPDVDGRQRKTLWCWAAVMQMVTNFHGVELEQEDIVMRAFGDLRNRPATRAEISAVMHGWELVDRHGQPWLFQVDSGEQIDAARFVHDLKFNHPLLVGLRTTFAGSGETSGHAFVMSEIAFHYDQRTGQIYPTRVALRDPWPEHPSSQVISWEEFKQRYMFHVQVRATPFNY